MGSFRKVCPKRRLTVEVHILSEAKHKSNQQKKSIFNDFGNNLKNYGKMELVKQDRS